MHNSLWAQKKHAGIAFFHSRTIRGGGHNPQTDLECVRSHGEVIIPSVQTLIAKFKALKAGGPQNLHILTDYD